MGGDWVFVYGTRLRSGGTKVITLTDPIDAMSAGRTFSHRRVESLEEGAVDLLDLERHLNRPARRARQPDDGVVLRGAHTTFEIGWKNPTAEQSGIAK